MTPRKQRCNYKAEKSREPQSKLWKQIL